jgi:nitroreductase
LPYDVGDDRFFEVVRRQRAHRSFSSEPVPDDLIARLLEAATFAPSAENSQPWVFMVVRRPELRQAIGGIYLRAWEAGARAVSSGRLGPALLKEVDDGARGGVASAPVIVVVCGDTRRSHPRALAASVYPAVQNLLLAAEACDLGSAFTTLAVTEPSGISRVLGLPDHVVPMAVVPVGRPSRTLGPPRREPFESKTYRDTFGEPW